MLRIPNRSSVAVLLLVALASIGVVSPAAPAAITIVGDVEPSDLSPDEVIVVGYDTFGHLTIDQGSVLTNTNNNSSFIGHSLGGNGNVTVTDPGSQLNLDSGLYMGFETGSTAQLSVLAGGAVDVDDSSLSIGYEGAATVLVSGADSTLTAQANMRLAARAGGSGKLEIQDGGSVVSNGGRVGTSDFGASGQVSVFGAGSTWTVNGNFDVLVGTAIVADGGAINVTGSSNTTTIGSDGSLTIAGGALTTPALVDNGSFNFAAGDIHLTNSGITIGVDGLLGAAASIDASSTVTVSGAAAIDAGATLTVLGSFETASLTNNGTLTLINTSTDTPIVSPAGSTINVIGDVQFNGHVGGAGGVFGSGNAIFNGGYTPGDSPAVVSVENDITFGGTNTLGIELGGLAAGEYDQLQVGGSATLDGSLDVSLIGPFTPGAGQEFMILDVAGNVTGQFTGLGEGALVGSYGGQDLFITYAAGSGDDVALFTAPVPEPSSLVLAVVGLAGLGLLRRRKLRMVA